ncbi:sulfotransferase family 2 domain-containing protein [Candidatus Sumerlaeota bacterium]|nr:sulfotransferase family 2 domain-containing protein [Candidatus Sumerlaeota bacterium]
MTNVIAAKLRVLRQEMRKEIQYLDAASRPRKILFDHLPKCGGSTLTAYLEAHYPRRKTFCTDGRAPQASVRHFKALPQAKRDGYDLVEGHLAHELLDFVHPDCLKVTVFRDPIDRVVSHYYFAQREPGHYLRSKILESSMSLEEYATSGLSDEIRNWYTCYFAQRALRDTERSPEQTVAKAVSVVLNRYDVIGFLDDFAAFAEALRSRARLRYEYRDHRVNVTQNRPPLESIPRSTLARIEEANRLDVAFYREIRNAIASRKSTSAHE